MWKSFFFFMWRSVSKSHDNLFFPECIYDPSCSTLFYCYHMLSLFMLPLMYILYICYLLMPMSMRIHSCWIDEGRHMKQPESNASNVKKQKQTAGETFCEYLDFFFTVFLWGVIDYRFINFRRTNLLLSDNIYCMYIDNFCSCFAQIFKEYINIDDFWEQKKAFRKMSGLKLMTLFCCLICLFILKQLWLCGLLYTVTVALMLS